MRMDFVAAYFSVWSTQGLWNNHYSNYHYNAGYYLSVISKQHEIDEQDERTATEDKSYSGTI